MLIQSPSLKARARVRVHHERAYDYDDAHGLYLYKQVDEDEEVDNLVTDAGRVTLHTFIYGSSAQRSAASLGTGMYWIGLSDDATAPAAGDTALTGELTALGLARADASSVGTITLPTGSGTITTISNQFTFTGATQGVQKTALFDAANPGGNMAHEIQFTQRTLFTNDTLTLTFSITLT